VETGFVVQNRVYLKMGGVSTSWVFELRNLDNEGKIKDRLFLKSPLFVQKRSEFWIWTTHSSAHSTSRFKGRGCKGEVAGDKMNAMASYDEAFNNSYHAAEETMTFSSLKVSFRCWSTFGPFSPPGVAHITFWQWWSGQTRLNSKNFDVSFRWCRRLGQSAIHRKMQRKNGHLNMRVMTKLSKMK